MLISLDHLLTSYFLSMGIQHLEPYSCMGLVLKHISYTWVQHSQELLYIEVYVIINSSQHTRGCLLKYFLTNLHELVNVIMFYWQYTWFSFQVSLLLLPWKFGRVWGSGSKTISQLWISNHLHWIGLDVSFTTVYGFTMASRIFKSVYR